VQAAEALEHAHQLGIVHRDIKPANVLVDGRGNLWITDFGLAHCQSQAGLTMTGDLVGTLRYMSPEQALAKRVVVDHRTDVYSLGATLYELLTLEQAFSGRDRQELLRQIAFDEPRPPRRLNRAIPRELETIVLKAMEKNPANRYGTAQELADDLERWLKDEPIRARRPTLVQRARKWCRRHRPVATSLATAFVAAVVLAVVMGFWYQRRLAETDRGVTAALAQAETLLAEADKQINFPERWQATARLALGALEKAEELLAAGEATEELTARVRQVRAAVDVAVTESSLLVALDRIRLEQATVKEGRFDNARAAPLYAKALGGYGIDLAAPEAAGARVRGSRLREPLLAALEDWSAVTPDVEQRQRLQQVLRAAEPEPTAFRTRWRAAVMRQDGVDMFRMVKESEIQALPAADVVRLAHDLTRVNEPAAAEQLLRAGQERYPSDFWLNHNLGFLIYHQKPPRAEEVVRFWTAALALRSDSPGVHLNLANALNLKGDHKGAARRYQAALDIDPSYAQAHNNLADTLIWLGRIDDAIGEYREATRLKKNFAEAHFGLAGSLSGTGREEEAIAEYREVIRIAPEHPEARKQLAGILNNLAGRLATSRDPRSLDPGRAVELAKEAVKLSPKFANAWVTLGEAYFQIGEWQSAIDAVQEAMKIGAFGNSWHFLLLARAHERLGHTGEAAKWRARADELESPAAARRFYGHASAVICVAFSPDGRRALSGAADETMRLWDVATGEELRAFIGVKAPVLGVAFSPDGRRALSAESGGTSGTSGTIRVWDVQRGEQLLYMQVDEGEMLGRVAFSLDGRRALSGSTKRGSPEILFRLWDLETGKEVRCIAGAGVLGGVALSPDGRRALTCGYDSAAVVRLWDLETGKEVRQFRGGKASVSEVAFSPDGRHALSIPYDGTRLWDLETGKEMCQFGKVKPSWAYLALSPDGRRALACVQETMRLGDLETGKEIARFSVRGTGLSRGAFSPDGRHALAGAFDGTLRLWQLPEAAAKETETPTPKK
jgi:tetratricopeptide (TPR) repeat protein